MNLEQNLAALQQISGLLQGGTPDAGTMIRLRQAAYLHVIIAAILSEQVDRLPETTQICR